MKGSTKTTEHFIISEQFFPSSDNNDKQIDELVSLIVTNK